MSEGVRVKDAAHRLGVSRARVYQLIERGRLRVVRSVEQPRQAGRFAAGGTLLDAEDVEREAQARGR